jgi:CHAT domain-containing protein
MSEQRQQAYLQLIQDLLSCPDGEEPEILEANQDLVDAGLMQMIEQVVEALHAGGEVDAADFLLNLASQLTQQLGLTTSGFTSQPLTTNSHLDLLLQVLQLIHDSDADPQAVYPLLEANLDKLDDRFVEVMQNWAKAALAKADIKIAQGLVAAINDLSNLIKELSLDNREHILEIAIAGYEIVTTVATQNAFPEEWAIIQVHLGNIYCDRIKGDKAENIEIAISYYLAALEVCTRTISAQKWGIIQKNLGNVYSERIRGDKPENLETAIKYYLAALEVITLETFPERWAEIQINLGAVYFQRVRGERAENEEAAIRCYLAALEVYTAKDFPEEWAQIQNNLGVAYRNRILGETAENLEAAIHHYSAALEVYKSEDFPQQWATIQMNLGSVYNRRLRGNREENLQLAIECDSVALSVYTREAFPEQWAILQNNLGSLYYDYNHQESGENFETAIRYFLLALEVRTREAFPERWAETQNNLGNIYLDRIQGEKADNLDAAIQYYSAALSVYTREAFPEAWADTQSNLGVTYNLRIRGNRSENSASAIRCHQAALAVYTRETNPQDWAVTQNNLGIAYLDAQQFPSAYTAFFAAIDTVESLRGEIASGSGRSEDKQKLAEGWNLLYQRMVEVCLELGNYRQAIEYVERSKTRNLVELILNRDYKTIFPSEVVKQLEQLRDEIASSQHKLQTAIADRPTVLAQNLEGLRKQRNELQDKYLPLGHGFNFDLFLLALNERTAIVEFFITTNKLLVFIITCQNLQPIVLPPEQINLGKFLKWANAYLRSYRTKKSQWQRRLKTRLHLLTKILHLDEIIKQIPFECDRLIFTPHRYLHLFPLHALPLTNDTNLCDRFPQGVSYIPSCQLLQLAQTRQRAEFTHLFAIQNPTDDLTYTDIEVEAIISYFDTTDIRKQKTATRKAIDKADLNSIHCAHFSCHGYFNAAQPRNSALILANAEPDLALDLTLPDGSIIDLNQCLTLDAIFSLNLDRCRLVTLSACETGLIDLENISDEYIGLPSGFIYAGSPNVVSSLWKVDDISTALLMIRFYQNLKAGSTVASALNTAQTWLCDSTQSQLLMWSKKLPLSEVRKREITETFDWFDADEQPFQNPYYWSGFCAIGQPT